MPRQPTEDAVAEQEAWNKNFEARIGSVAKASLSLQSFLGLRTSEHVAVALPPYPPSVSPLAVNAGSQSRKRPRNVNEPRYPSALRKEIKLDPSSQVIERPDRTISRQQQLLDLLEYSSGEEADEINQRCRKPQKTPVPTKASSFEILSSISDEQPARELNHSPRNHIGGSLLHQRTLVPDLAAPYKVPGLAHCLNQWLAHHHKPTPALGTPPTTPTRPSRQQQLLQPQPESANTAPLLAVSLYQIEKGRTRTYLAFPSSEAISLKAVEVVTSTLPTTLPATPARLSTPAPEETHWLGLLIQQQQPFTPEFLNGERNKENVSPMFTTSKLSGTQPAPVPSIPTSSPYHLLAFPSTLISRTEIKSAFLRLAHEPEEHVDAPSPANSYDSGLGGMETDVEADGADADADAEGDDVDGHEMPTPTPKQRQPGIRAMKTDWRMQYGGKMPLWEEGGGPWVGEGETEIRGVIEEWVKAVGRGQAGMRVWRV